MEYRLGGAARAAGHRLHVHAALPSTNAEALERARAGEAGPLWIVAHRQSAGRGRRGAAWVSPPGNLAATLLWPVADVAPDRIATLGFVAGLALLRASDAVLAGAGAGSDVALRRDAGQGTALRLKWPNDVLAARPGATPAKLAGILLEADGRRTVAIGFGVNVAQAPAGLPYPATALAALGCGADAAELFEALTVRFVETARIWNKGAGFSRIRQLWLERAAGVGDPVAVRLAGGLLEGRHDGIDEEGRLRVLAPDGSLHAVTAGDVHFGSAATAA